MHEEFEKDIQNNIPKLKDKTHILLFSTGADSVASYLRLREWGIKPILVYKYFLPHIPMVDNYIDYFEKKFDVKVYRLPHELYADYTDNALFQLPMKRRESFRNAIGTQLLTITNTRQETAIVRALGLKRENVVFDLGIRYTDGWNRFYNLQKNGSYTKNGKFFPIASFKVSDIQDLLKKYNCYLPIEYKLWGISLEGARSFNMPLIKENCPASYEYIKSYFPLVGTLCYRDKYTTLNQHFKTRLKEFADYAIPKELYDRW